MAIKAVVYYQILLLPNFYSPEDNVDYRDNKSSLSSDNKSDYSDNANDTNSYKDGYLTLMIKLESDFELS